MNRHLQYTREGYFWKCSREEGGGTWEGGLHGPLLAVCDTTEKRWEVGRGRMKSYE